MNKGEGRREARASKMEEEMKKIDEKKSHLKKRGKLKKKRCNGEYNALSLIVFPSI
jgi:hypothetical protein